MSTTTNNNNNNNNNNTKPINQCIICNDGGSSSARNKRNIIELFGKRNKIKQSNDNKSIPITLSSILNRTITEKTTHSNVICKKCIKLCDEYEELNRRLNNITTQINERYKETITTNNIKEDNDNDTDHDDNHDNDPHNDNNAVADVDDIDNVNNNVEMIVIEEAAEEGDEQNEEINENIIEGFHFNTTDEINTNNVISYDCGDIGDDDMFKGIIESTSNNNAQELIINGEKILVIKSIDLIKDELMITGLDNNYNSGNDHNDNHQNEIIVSDDNTITNLIQSDEYDIAQNQDQAADYVVEQNENENHLQLIEDSFINYSDNETITKEYVIDNIESGNEHMIEFGDVDTIIDGNNDDYEEIYLNDTASIITASNVVENEGNNNANDDGIIIAKDIKIENDNRDEAVDKKVSKKTAETDINEPPPMLKRDGFNFYCQLCVDAEDKLIEYDIASMERHMKTKHNKKIFLCELCGADFSKRNELYDHINEHSQLGSQNFECDVCKRNFKTLRLFRLHKRVHTTKSGKSHPCKVCHKAFNSQNLVDEHMNMHTGERPYRCNKCAKDFASRYTLTAHMKIHTKRERPYQCDECDKTFYSNQNLVQHKRTHSATKDFICTVCNKAFGAQHNLDVHKIVHSGYKPFMCRTCGKAFARRAEVKDHERIHTGERPFTCELCDTSFAQRSNLSSHMRATHYNDKRYKCEKCKRSFKRRRLLDYHIRAAHTMERPYKCNLCVSTFVYPEHFKKHLRIHTGVKPYSCEVCGKAFNSRDNRNAHRFVHSDKKPYECLVCGQGFMRKPVLLAHMNQQNHVKDTIIVNQPRISTIESRKVKIDNSTNNNKSDANNTIQIKTNDSDVDADDIIVEENEIYLEQHDENGEQKIVFLDDSIIEADFLEDDDIEGEDYDNYDFKTESNENVDEIVDQNQEVIVDNQTEFDGQHQKQPPHDDHLQSDEISIIEMTNDENISVIKSETDGKKAPITIYEIRIEP